MRREAGMKFDANGIPSFDKSKLRTGRDRWLMLQRLVFPTLGGRPIAEIKKSEVITLRDKIAGGELKHNGRNIRGGEVAADRTLAVIRKVFAWHASREDDFRSPIVPGLNLVKASEQSRDRTLNDDELRVIWRTVSRLAGPFPAYLRFLLLTGARRTEASRMTWAEVSPEGDWLLPAARNKTKRDLVRPLSKAALAVLEAQPKIVGCDLIFTNNGRRAFTAYSTFKRRFDGQVLRTLREENPEAGPLANWTLHDLRRTARTLLSRAGVNSDHAERCHGHVVAGVRGVYDRHRYHAEMATAYEALSSMIERITNPPADNVVAFQPIAGNVYGQA
jgi:integrase